MPLAAVVRSGQPASGEAALPRFGTSKLSVRLLLLVLLAAVPVFAVEAYYELEAARAAAGRERPAGAANG